jgi:hypothetical protein
MKHRPRRSLPAAIVTLVVLGVCVVVAITEIQHLTGYQPPLIPFDRLATYGQHLRFSDTPVIIAGAVAAGVGLILLGCGIIPGKHTVLPLARLEDDAENESPTGSSAGVARRRLRAALRYTLTETDGITHARLRLRRRKVTAKVRTERRDPQTVAEGAREALDRSLTLASLASTPRVRLRTTSTHRKKTA